MARFDPSVIGGTPVDLQEIIDELDEELEPTQASAPRDAICRSNGITIETSLELRGTATLAAKKQAIIMGRPDLLTLLLERDNSIDEDAVVTACELKDRDSVRVLLNFGWPINQQLISMASLLCTAINDLAFMKWLVENGADVNARSRLNESTLSSAIVHGSMEAVQYLFAQGTDIVHGDLLHCAAQRKNQAEGAILVQSLVERGADVNAHRFDNPVAFRWRALFKLPTPLHVACDTRNIHVAQALLRNGANPHSKMLEAGIYKSPTPIEKALWCGDRDMVELLESFLG